MADETDTTSATLRAPEWAHAGDVTTCADGTLYQVPRTRTLKGVNPAHVDELLAHGYTRDTGTPADSGAGPGTDGARDDAKKGT